MLHGLQAPKEQMPRLQITEGMKAHAKLVFIKAEKMFGEMDKKRKEMRLGNFLRENDFSLLAFVGRSASGEEALAARYCSLSNGSGRIRRALSVMGEERVTSIDLGNEPIVFVDGTAETLTGFSDGFEHIATLSFKPALVYFDNPDGLELIESFLKEGRAVFSGHISVSGVELDGLLVYNIQ